MANTARDSRVPMNPERRPGPSADEEAYEQLKLRLHHRLISDLDPSRMAQMDKDTLAKAVEEAINVLLQASPETSLINRNQRARLLKELKDEILGFGPLQPLLDDPTVSEIMVNSAKEIYVEREGVISRYDRTFRDDAHIMQVIERIIAPLGRRLDESSPMVDARAPGGYRLNAVIPPLALKGPTVTVRKFFDDRFGIEDLVRIGTISQEAATLMRLVVLGRLNLIISGGTGTGKTTFLNALSAFIPATERIITIENPAELRLKQDHVVRLETRPPSIDGRNEVTQRALVVNALRMRPDRIIVGEVRAGEAFDMLQAMNTGHDGSITTVHANSPRDALSRIENMVMMAGFDLPIRAIREQVASAVQVIIQLSRLRDGSRRVTHITEVSGMEGQTITLQDVFVGQQTGVNEDGRIIYNLVPTGIRPTFMDRLAQYGLTMNIASFARVGAR
ncbi:MAG TPA: CpaF family protein [Dehalococcoidia bacterium]|nr:CpaF family protein [Dehalococcoidia bacterium]